MGRFGYLPLASLCFLGGCHSAFIDASVRNVGEKPISLIEVDYPSASFGLQALASGGEKHYRFKVLGTGSLKITYTDASGKEHTAAGPMLHEGLAGTLTIVVSNDAVQWKPELK